MFPLGRGIVGLSREGEYARRHEQPLGYALVLFAATKGVPLIGVLTDMNHHTGPVSATFDLLYAESEDERRGRPVFKINDSRVQLFDERDLSAAFCLTDGSMTTTSPYQVPEDERGAYVREGEHGFESAKNWLSLLERITQPE